MKLDSESDPVSTFSKKIVQTANMAFLQQRLNPGPLYQH